MKYNTLYLCEKPDQGRHLAKALGWKGGYAGSHIENGKDVIGWGLGHLLSQAKPETYVPELKKGWNLLYLPIVPPTDGWVMQASEGKEKQVKVIGNLIKNCLNVVIATDFDREGETIAVELLEYFNYKGPTKRMKFSSLDVKSLQKSHDNMLDGQKTYPLYLAGLGRMRCDWLFGLNVTMALTASNKKFLMSREVLSAGRVQTPIIYLVVTRENEIKQFKPTTHYTIETTFINEKGERYVGHMKTEKEWLNEAGLFTDKALAEKTVKTFLEMSAIISKYTTTEKRQPPPLGYTLDTLQAEAINKWNYSAKSVLDIAQRLYETHKIISYPRTDCPYMPTSQFKDGANILVTIHKNQNKRFNEMVGLTDAKCQSPIWNDKKMEDKAHHAIIPINTDFDVSQLDQDEHRIYDLICRRYVMQFMEDYRYSSSKILTKVQSHVFETSGNVVLHFGWKKALDKDEKSGKESLLPLMHQGDLVTVDTSEVKSKKTTPPASYTEASLIQDMVNVQKYVTNPKLKKIIKAGGIGTNATRGKHIENLFSKKYLTKVGKKVSPTDKAIALIEIVPDELKRPEITAFWEEALNAMASGKISLDQFMQKQDITLRKMVDKIKSGQCQLKKPVAEGTVKIYICEKCDGVCSRIKSKIKSKKGQNFFWKCNACGKSYEDQNGKRGAIKVRLDHPKPPTKIFPCQKCGKEMLYRRGKSQELFWVCSNDRCETYAYDNQGKPIFDVSCIKCGGKNTMVRRKKKKDGTFFWVCTDQKCGVFAQDKGGKPIRENYEKCTKCSQNTMARRKKKKDGTFFWVCIDKKCNAFAKDADGKLKATR